jgi:hypothetical protein
VRDLDIVQRVPTMHRHGLGDAVDNRQHRPGVVQEIVEVFLVTPMQQWSLGTLIVKELVYDLGLRAECQQTHRHTDFVVLEVDEENVVTLVDLPECR